MSHAKILDVAHLVILYIFCGYAYFTLNSTNKAYAAAFKDRFDRILVSLRWDIYDH